MLKNNILTIFLYILLSLGNTTHKTLIHETLIIESLTLSKDELIDKVINNYNIPTNYNQIQINTNYFNSPEYNKIYSINLVIDYPETTMHYILKLKVINTNTNIQDINTPLIIILSSIIIIFIILYIKRSN